MHQKKIIHAQHDQLLQAVWSHFGQTAIKNKDKIILEALTSLKEN